jgi:two-component system, LytTR family, response regulator
MNLRAIIVDDEPLARERLAQLLACDPEVEIVAECGTGLEAVDAFHQHRPDLVFLDVRMPELDGFGVVEKLKGEKLPAIIFVTAYDKFAVQAFEVNALDYLLKPFDKERLKKALARARHAIQHNSLAEISQRIHSAIAGISGAPAPEQHSNRIAIKTDGRVLLLKPEEIDWVESADNYVIFHRGAETHIHRETLSALEQKLSPRQFLRISRSVIVNMDRVKELQPMFHGDYAVIMQTGARLTLSRNYREKLSMLTGR